MRAGRDRRANGRRRRRGAAVVEFAVCLPILALLVFGAIDACSLIYLRQSLSIAAYEGARTAILPEIEQDQVEYVCQQILDGRSVDGYSITVAPDPQLAAVGDYIAVTISAPSEQNSLIGGWVMGSHTIQARVEMMNEY